MHTLVEQFLVHARTSGRPPESVRALRNDLTSLHRFCAKKSVTFPSRLTKPKLEAWLKTSKTMSTRSRWATTARHFFEWMNQLGHMDRDPAAMLSVPRKIERAPTIDLDPLRGTLEEMKPESDTEARAMLIVALFMDTAARPRELADLNISDVDTKTKVVTLARGGELERDVSYGSMVDRFLPFWRRSRAYIVSEKDKPDPHAMFIEFRQGERVSDRTLNRQTSIVAKLLDAKMDGSSIRNSVAKEFREEFGDEEANRLLGVKSAWYQRYRHDK